MQPGSPGTAVQSYVPQPEGGTRPGPHYPGCHNGAASNVDRVPAGPGRSNPYDGSPPVISREQHYRGEGDSVSAFRCRRNRPCGTKARPLLDAKRRSVVPEGAGGRTGSDG